MPRLASPEVIVEEKMSGLTIFRQQEVIRAENDNTDVGINDSLGLNVISSTIELYLVTPTANPQTTLNMTIRLSEVWPETQDFIKNMQGKFQVGVKHSVNPFEKTRSSLSVTGLKDIEILTDVFRNVQFVSQHQGAEIYRQMVNPALLGEAVEYAEKKVGEYFLRIQKSEWPEKFEELGWRKFPRTL